MLRNIKKNSEFKNFDQSIFRVYLDGIIHEWSKTLTTLGFTLVPLFFILDYFTMPEHLLTRFALYRLVATIIAVVQFVMIKITKPGRLSFIHGYIVSIIVGGVIVLMTNDLGGINSRYYAGLNLVIIGVNLLLPWESYHSAINGLMIILTYVIVNLIGGKDYDISILVNNLFFMNATVVIAVSINHVRHRLIKREFILRSEVKIARDALWGEMQIAKKIQTSLLPDKDRVSNYQIAAAMLPAEEVGGDYYDIIETKKGEYWITIGDVSGHGVTSGLIMMMTQTSIYSLVNNTPGYMPSKLLDYVNTVIRKNIGRLGVDNYMTIMALRLDENKVTFAGKHQDIILHRVKTGTIEVITNDGTWLGLADDISGAMKDQSLSIEIGDTILLITDGITEAMDRNKEMYGEGRLINSFKKNSSLPLNETLDNIIKDVNAHQETQYDDITAVLIRKIF